MDKKNMNKHIGDLNQLITYQESKLLGGFSEGVKVVNVSNGSNLQVTLVPDRCLDIYQVRYKGINLNYLYPVGITAPGYYEADTNQFLRKFFVGMLTTCGLQNVGVPGTVLGEEKGLHGRIGNIPAEYYFYERGWTEDLPTLTVKARMREAKLFFENLVLEREFTFVYGKDEILMKDTITNESYSPRQFAYGLHINFGYPLLEKGTEINLDSESVKGVTDEAEKYIETWNQVESPTDQYEERCYYHDIKPDANGDAVYEIYNPNLNIGMKVSYPKQQLPFFTQWKMLGSGEYVMGLEPFNCVSGGPKLGEPECKAPVLEPGESIVYNIKFEGYSK
ncbi:MAG TPA: aldose 1-epimerase family protein [Clostridiaceae bacterium]|nr:aldose 1-epimerase family protein [Clostridiaceae bacterium]